jgi:hypothetical protein
MNGCGTTEEPAERRSEMDVTLAACHGPRPKGDPAGHRVIARKIGDERIRPPTQRVAILRALGWQAVDDQRAGSEIEDYPGDPDVRQRLIGPIRTVAYDQASKV